MSNTGVHFKAMMLCTLHIYNYLNHVGTSYYCTKICTNLVPLTFRSPKFFTDQETSMFLVPLNKCSELEGQGWFKFGH